MNHELRCELIEVARGLRPADVVLRNGSIVNVVSGEVIKCDLAIHKDRIVGMGNYIGRKTIDVQGSFIAPGFIDAHMHLESSMVTAREFTRAVVPRGTTSIVCDPHEIANVLGLDGIKYILDSSEGLPLDVFVMLPSCVPATHLETSGANLSADDLLTLSSHPRVLGLGEMMNVPGVLNMVPGVLDKLRLFSGRVMDGHCPELSGLDLAAYVASGITSDHECAGVPEALEKLRMGMHIMLREGTAAKNVSDLAMLVTPQNAFSCHFCTDDRHPVDLVNDGHMDAVLRIAVRNGIDPITAIQMATIHTADYFGLKEHGRLIPGSIADIVVLDSLDSFRATMVFKSGKVVAEQGIMTSDLSEPFVDIASSSMKVDWTRLNLRVNAPVDKPVKVRTIEVIPDQIITRYFESELPVQGGEVLSDPSSDILKIAVIERHHGTGDVGVGFVKGFGLREGAIASSVAHDSHNLIVIGTNDEDMLVAAQHIESLGGGQAVVTEGKVLAELPLPIAGLMSPLSLEQVLAAADKCNETAVHLGCSLKDPFMTMSFLALPVIPELKMTDKGLINVNEFQVVSLFV